MKYIYLIIAGLFFGIANTCIAQTSKVHAHINVAAQIVPSGIEMLTIKSINLADADQEDNRIDINPVTGPNAGKMIATGNPDSDIRISFQKTQKLTQADKSAPLQFIYNISSNTKDNQSSSEILYQNNRDLKFNDQGRLYLWIGGNVDISNAKPGNYQGELTLDIEYI